jgi:hypothetical protein
VVLYAAQMKLLMIPLATLCVAFGVNAQDKPDPQARVEACNAAQTSYREAQARVMALGATYFDRSASKKATEASLTLQEIQNELTAATLSLQYMQLAGCAAPTPAPDLHRAGQDQYACGVATTAGREPSPKGTDVEPCQKLKARMNDVRGGKP